MRYAVTGAAGFIGSHLAEALVAGGHEVVGIDCFTDYYDPALKEENARGLDVLRLDLAEDELDFAGFDGVFHLAGQPGVRSFGDVFPLYLRRNVLASQRVFEAAARDGVRVVFASSSSVYGAAERYPTPEETPPRPLSPYGITKLACEHLADAYGREFGLDCVVLRYFNAFGPRQRPDMAFTRIVLALAEGTTFELFGDGDQSRGWTYVSDVVDATVAAMAGGEGHLQRGRRARGVDERVDRAVRADLGEEPRRAASCSGARRPAADERGHDAHPLGARLGAARVARGWAPAAMGMGLGGICGLASLSRRTRTAASSVHHHRSAPDERSHRQRLRARDRPRPLARSGRRALVGRRRGAPRRRGRRRDPLALRRQPVGSLGPSLAGAGVLAERLAGARLPVEPARDQHLVTPESVAEGAAAATAHVSVTQLRGNVNTASVSTGTGTIATRGTVLVRITVQLRRRQSRPRSRPTRSAAS